MPNSRYPLQDRNGMQTSSKVLNQLKLLETLYRQGGLTATIEQTLDQVLQQELAISQQKQAELDRDLQAFETQYQWSSKEFVQRFRTGLLGDDVDFVEWDAVYRLKESLQNHIDLLTMNEPLS
jgi:hypothetical protein